MDLRTSRQVPAGIGPAEAFIGRDLLEPRSVEIAAEGRVIAERELIDSVRFVELC